MNRQNKNFKLPFIIDDIGRWWGNNPEKKCQEEIDIVAFSKKLQFSENVNGKIKSALKC